MAANLDKAESSLTTVSDLAYIRGVDASGNSVKISKSDLASVLGGTSNFITRAQNANYYIRTAGSGSGSVDTEIDLTSISENWGIGMIVIVAGSGSGGLYLVYGSNQGVNTETLKSHPSITSFTLDGTTKHLIINHSGYFTARIVHNMAFAL